MSSQQLTSSEIKKLRQEIKKINTQIIDLIADRVETAEKIGEHKKAQNIPVYQPEQEQAVLNACHKRANEAGLDGQMVEEIFADIIALSRNAQMSE